MKTFTAFLSISLFLVSTVLSAPASSTDQITLLSPPQFGFFSKQLMFEGIPIKAHEVVSNEALKAAQSRLSMMFSGFGYNRKQLLRRIKEAGIELHIIGKDQVTTDLPEWRHDKGKHLPEYNGQTRDERTRGMGGQLVSCGEENLLKLPTDRYFGRDICIHEFSHVLRNYGLGAATKQKFENMYRSSITKGLWKGAYAATNPDEFFAELSMWYFGTHGDLAMTGTKPEAGRQGLKQYDPEAYALFDALYNGRLGIN